jgi:hypothetical protein
LGGFVIDAGNLDRDGEWEASEQHRIENAFLAVLEQF